MKIAQLFGVKTNPSQQPRCCHKRSDGSECKAHPRKGRQYCFLHDPASEKKSAAARRAGGVIRGYKAQEVLKLPPNLPALPLRDTGEVVEMFRVTVNHFRQGEMDLRSANCIRNFGLAMLRGFEFDARTQREAARAAAPRTFSGKKLPLQGVNFVIRDIKGAQIYPRETAATSAPNPLSPPSQPEPKPDTARLDKREDKPEQGMQDSLSPASAASAQNQTKAQQQTEQNEPKPNDQNKSQQNGHSAMSPAPPSTQPVASPPQENPPVHYPPGLGPRYMTVATPSMPWWRRQQFNNPGFVTGTVPQTAAMPAPRFRGTRP